MRMPHLLIFILVMTALVTVVHYYIWRRIIHDTRLPTPWRWGASAILAVLAISLPTTILLVRVLDIRVARGVFMVPFLWMGTMMMLFFLLVFSDLIKLVSKVIAQKPLNRPFDSSRRTAMNRIVAGAVVTTTGGLASAAVINGKLDPIIKKIEVKLDNLPNTLSGFRIVQLTDIHIGNTLNRKWLQNVIAQTNRLKPDLIAITGDVVDGTPSALRKETALLSNLKAPRGVYLVTGNHEYYSGADAWIREFESYGIRVLRNESVSIKGEEGSFRIVGIDDFHGRRIQPGHGPDLEKALAGIPMTEETVLLAHQPKAIHEAAKHGVGLVLSGHTHGGQIWPITQLVLLQQPYNKGLFRHDDTTQIYVSQGTGYWGPPMRLGSSNEITEITLRSKA